MEAYLYEPLEDGKVKCYLCSHRCVIKAGRRGICGVRENQDGRLQTLVYDKIIAQHVDPIEKKPLFHFLPGTLSYSIATVGCNFRCRFCQNAD
ncbi:MAG: radical SAM protein, partial [Desulfobacterales bacterium]